ncbi:MAG: DUF4249 domain-containing protein [Saprospiraceae bacterium]|nr:DUF4249 domain-containing protein [Saprospiraceae bacterium]
MKNLKYIFLIILGASFLASCDGDFFETTVPVEIPPHESTLAVSAIFIGQNEVHDVYVSNSLSILSKEDNLSVNDATVTISEAGNETDIPFYLPERLYRLDEGNTPLFEAEKTYTITVSHPDFPTASATATMPKAARIVDFKHERDGTIDESGYEVDEITIEIEDLSHETNYYVFEMAERYAYINGTDTSFVYNPVSSLISRDPLVRYGFHANFYEGLPMISDATFNGHTYQLKLYTYDKPQSGNQLVIQCYSVNKARYDYLASLQSFVNNQDNPFSEPVNVISNIENGVGIFALQNKAERVVEVE